MDAFYQDKSVGYFSSVRREIIGFLPNCESKRALDVGCGEGATLAWLKSQGRCKETWGIEFHPPAADKAREVLDNLICVDIERAFPDIPPGSFDLILCLDVLEHLQDPWGMVDRLSKLLAPGGMFLISVPNLRHFPVIKNLLLNARFDYEERGVLDRTHLRFFTAKTAGALMEGAELHEVSVALHPQNIGGWRRVVNSLTFGFFRDFFSWQIIVLGRRPLTSF